MKRKERERERERTLKLKITGYYREDDQIPS